MTATAFASAPTIPPVPTARSTWSVTDVHGTTFTLTLMRVGYWSRKAIFITITGAPITHPLLKYIERFNAEARRSRKFVMEVATQHYSEHPSYKLMVTPMGAHHYGCQPDLDGEPEYVVDLLRLAVLIDY